MRFLGPCLQFLMTNGKNATDRAQLEAGLPGQRVVWPPRTGLPFLEQLMVEIAVAAQDEFNVEIPDDQLKNLKTVKDVVNFIQA